MWLQDYVNPPLVSFHKRKQAATWRCSSNGDPCDTRGSEWCQGGLQSPLRCAVQVHPEDGGFHFLCGRECWLLMAQRSPSWSCPQLHAPLPPAAKGQPCNDWFVYSAKAPHSGPNSGYLCRARGPLPFNLSSLGSHPHASICLLGEPDLHHLQLWQRLTCYPAL